jgi:hypothetical protein
MLLNPPSGGGKPEISKAARVRRLLNLLSLKNNYLRKYE